MLTEIIVIRSWSNPWTQMVRLYIRLSAGHRLMAPYPQPLTTWAGRAVSTATPLLQRLKSKWVVTTINLLPYKYSWSINLHKVAFVIQMETWCSSSWVTARGSKLIKSPTPIPQGQYIASFFHLLILYVQTNSIVVLRVLQFCILDIQEACSWEGSHTFDLC